MFRPENIKIENREDKGKQLLAVVAKEKSILEKIKDKTKAIFYEAASALAIEKAAKKAGIDPNKIIEQMAFYQLIKKEE